MSFKFCTVFQCNCIYKAILLVGMLVEIDLYGGESKYLGLSSQGVEMCHLICVREAEVVNRSTVSVEVSWDGFWYVLANWLYYGNGCMFNSGVCWALWVSQFLKPVSRSCDCCLPDCGNPVYGLGLYCTVAIDKTL